MAGSVAEPISDHRTPRQVESAVPGASPCGVLNQSGSSLWEAQGIRTPLIPMLSLAGALGRYDLPCSRPPGRKCRPRRASLWRP